MNDSMINPRADAEAFLKRHFPASDPLAVAASGVAEELASLIEKHRRLAVVALAKSGHCVISSRTDGVLVDGQLTFAFYTALCDKAR